MNSISEDADVKDEKSGSKWVAYLIEGSIVLLALLLGLLIRAGVYETVVIPSGSMEPTLAIGDRLLVDHRTSLHGHWKRGDMITFDPPESWQDPDKDLLIKRIIGLPGETIDIQGGLVSVNGQAVQEDYIKEPMQPDDPVRFSLGQGEYFVMGDNRNNSGDSRENGPVQEKDIRGRAVWRLAPLSRMGGLPHPKYP